MKAFLALSPVVVYLLLAGSASAQNAASSFLPSVDSQAGSSHESSCKPLELQSAAELSLHQRSCLYGRKLIAPSMAMRAVFSSAYGQLRNAPFDHGDGMDEFGRRFGVYYARRTAQFTSEMMAGYLAHEDPRFHPSQQTGVWNRARGALLNVLTAQGENGSTRPAFAPIAGSLSSGMVTMAMYRTRNGLGDGLTRSGLAYGGYVGTALIHEFQPDLTIWAEHLLHRQKQ